MTTLRVVAFVVGLALLAAAAHVTITYAGGYTAPQAILTLTIALGVGVAALAIGAAWSGGRSALAGWLLAAIIAGEAFGFLMTSERLIAGREATQAPIRTALEAHSKASLRVIDASEAMASIPTTSARLEAALSAKAVADAAAVEKSAQHGCAANCRALLQAQVDAAAVEVAGARQELAARRAAAENELEEARTALAEAKELPSATPLADRLGLPAWILDLLTAGLGSMAANGLGCGLIAFAAHGRRDANPVVNEAAVRLRKRVVCESDHAAQFAVECLAPAPQSRVALAALHATYLEWCSQKNIEGLPAARIGAELAALFDGTGITFMESRGKKFVLGVKVGRSSKGRSLTQGESLAGISVPKVPGGQKLKMAASG